MEQELVVVEVGEVVAHRLETCWRDAETLVIGADSVTVEVGEVGFDGGGSQVLVE